MKIVYKNSPPSHLMRASSTENYELITDNFINFSNSTYCVIFVQSRPAGADGMTYVSPALSIQVENDSDIRKSLNGPQLRMRKAPLTGPPKFGGLSPKATGGMYSRSSRE